MRAGEIINEVVAEQYSLGRLYGLLDRLRPVRMPTFMDIHKVEGVSVMDAAKAHKADLETQGKYGVSYMRYWVDEKDGTLFCLVDAPDAETAERVHREADGMVAEELHEVVEGA